MNPVSELSICCKKCKYEVFVIDIPLPIKCPKCHHIIGEESLFVRYVCEKCKFPWIDFISAINCCVVEEENLFYKESYET